MSVPNGQEEEEALEIERVLLERLQAGIDRKVPCSYGFRKSKEALKKQIGIPMDSKARARFRKRLHILNNLLADSDSIFDHLNACLCHRLNQITKEIESDSRNISDGNQNKKPTTTTLEERPPSTPMMALTPRGLEIDEMAVKNLLLHRTAKEEFNAVGIVGSERVGKTSLAQVIFQNDKVKSRFLPRIWVSLSKNLDDFSQKESAEIIFAKRILLALGFDDEAINEMKQSSREESFLTDLIYAIRSELTRKRYLIVLDDALESNEWYEDLQVEPSPDSEMEKKLAYALPKGNGGAVVVTGRAERVVKKMIGGDGNGIHGLLPLDKPNLCWEIYMEAAGVLEENMKDEEEKQKEKDAVVKRSNPADAVLMGEARKKRIMEEDCWPAFLEGAGERGGEIGKEDEEKIREELKRCNGNAFAARKMGEERRKKNIEMRNSRNR